jgi:hypothetical protein
MLCWAATGQMIAESMGKVVTQCEQVRWRHGACSCLTCPSAASAAVDDCNNGGWPDFDRFDVHAERTVGRALPLDMLKDELACKHRPVAFSWHTGEGTGHIMVANGYVHDFIEILDPWGPCTGDSRAISYEEYVNGNNLDSSHWDDFYGLTLGAKQ